MKIRTLFLTMIAVLLILPVATGAMAAESANQDVEVSVMAANVRSIWVEEGFGLGIAIPDTSTEARYFGMQLTNTYSGVGFEVVVDGGDLVSYYWDEPCDEYGCTRYLDGLYTIPKTNLFVQGGTLNWDPEPVTAHGAYLSASGPVLIMESTADAYGAFDVANAPFVQLDVPASADYADYITTLTYTIQAPTP